VSGSSAESVPFPYAGLRPEAESLVQQHSAKDRGARAIFVKTDVTIWDELTHAFEVADAEFGGADIVCPGAGESIAKSSFPCSMIDMLIFHRYLRASLDKLLVSKTEGQPPLLSSDTALDWNADPLISGILLVQGRPKTSCMATMESVTTPCWIST
jgi:NAD(P)-dependent dehydrogenase (short-subunit alcohol dehydrogenase family)